MKPKVDPELCVGCGLCVDICPEVFELGDDGIARVANPDACAQLESCREAADSCPVEAIIIEE